MLATSGAAVEERKKSLYGSRRKDNANEIKGRLTKSCILQDGEYNYVPKVLRTVVWNTSTQRDFAVSYPTIRVPCLSVTCNC